MTARRNLYDVLGLAKDADADAIKKSYRKLARQYHPDVNPGDAKAEERFKEISEAYAVLSDEEKKRNYDEFGEISLEGGFDPEAARAAFAGRFGGGPGAGAPFGFDGQSFEFGDLEDLLGRAFRGGARSRAAGMRGQDAEAVLDLDFLEAAKGAEKRVTLTRPGPDGTPRPETVNVRIPAGVADGGRIRLAGKGGPGFGGGPPGDLYATIRVRPHPVLRREGRNLLVDLPLTVGEAVRGARIEVPTLDGRATLTIPEGTDSGQKLRLRGKGIPDPAGGPAGDLIVVVQIRVPRELDDEARAKLDELGAFDPDDVRAELFS